MTQVGTLLKLFVYLQLNQATNHEIEEHGEVREKGEIKMETFANYFESMGWVNLVGFILCTLLMLIS